MTVTIGRGPNIVGLRYCTVYGNYAVITAIISFSQHSTEWNSSIEVQHEIYTYIGGLHSDSRSQTVIEESRLSHANQITNIRTASRHCTLTSFAIYLLKACTAATTLRRRVHYGPVARTIPVLPGRIDSPLIISSGCRDIPAARCVEIRVVEQCYEKCNTEALPALGVPTCKRRIASRNCKSRPCVRHY